MDGNLQKSQPTLMTYLGRGWRLRCPACGEGRLLHRYLKVVPACASCGEALHHHRADDFPAYIVIVLLGHILVPLVVEVELRFEPVWWVHVLLWLPLTALLTYLLLPRVKGAVVGLQWHMGLHGFAESKKKRTTTRL